MTRTIRDALSAETAASRPDFADDAAREELTEQAPAGPEEYAPADPTPFEANPADVAEQAKAVPIDDEERERS